MRTNHSEKLINTLGLPLSFEVENGARNMQRDMQLLFPVQQGSADVLFRSYTWQPWCVSLGKHQSADVIDQKKLKERGYDLVWRPTGGRAVFHAQELTYCIAARANARELYESVHAMLHKALTEVVGKVLTFTESSTDFRQHYASGTPMGLACFTSSAKSEILFQNKKVVGSAQRVMDGVVLQHGSILCGPAHMEIADLLVMSDEQRVKFTSSLNSSSISLSEIAGRTISPAEVAHSIDKLRHEFSPEHLPALLPAP